MSVVQRMRQALLVRVGIGNFEASFNSAVVLKLDVRSEASDGTI